MNEEEKSLDTPIWQQTVWRNASEGLDMAYINGRRPPTPFFKHLILIGAMRFISLSLSLWLFLKPIKEKTTTANACLLQLRIHKRYPHRLPLPHSTPQFTVALAIVLLFSSFFNLKSCFFTKFYSRKIYIKSNICI